MMPSGAFKWHSADKRIRAAQQPERDIGRYYGKIVEREIPPRPKLTDSRGQPISLPKLRFLGETP